MDQSSPSYELEAGEEHDTSLTPDERLMVAVLVRAVRDFVNYRDSKEGSKEYQLAVDATEWIFWDGQEPMTFLHICENTGLDPVKIRRETLLLTRDELRRRQKDVEDD